MTHNEKVCLQKKIVADIELLASELHFVGVEDNLLEAARKIKEIIIYSDYSD